VPEVTFGLELGARASFDKFGTSSNAAFFVNKSATGTIATKAISIIVSTVDDFFILFSQFFLYNNGQHRLKRDLLLVLIFSSSRPFKGIIVRLGSARR